MPEGDLTMTDSIETASPECERSYPEGGFEANLVLFGSFCAIMGGLGMMNSIGIYQAWISTNQLQDMGESEIGWIFGLYNFMVFFCGIQIGPIFDSRGPRWLMITGLVLFIVTFVALGFCQVYWHFLVVIGLVGGAATSVIFCVPVACLGHYFYAKRGGATGLAMTGGSLGGIMFPLILEDLSPRIGFAWATRVVGLITVMLVVVGCVLVRSPRHTKRDAIVGRNLLPDLSILLSPAVALTTVGVFFIEWGFFVGLEYVASYSLSYGISRTLSYQMVVFLNAGSFPGRWLPGIMADKVGRLNTLIITNILCIIAMLAIWLPAKGNVAATIVFAVVFGFASGSNISLVPVCIGEMCDTKNYGRYYTTVYTVVSFGYVPPPDIVFLTRVYVVQANVGLTQCSDGSSDSWRDSPPQRWRVHGLNTVCGMLVRRGRALLSRRQMD